MNETSWKRREKLAEEFFQEINKEDRYINLARAALLIAKIEYPKLYVDKYLRSLDVVAKTIRERVNSGEKSGLFKTATQYLFKELGLKGNRDDYYSPRNSFLNEVLERRTGLPILLSIILLEVCWRLGLPLEGVGMPGRFIVKLREENREIFTDPFNGGKILTVEDCRQILEGIYGGAVKLQPEHLNSVTKRQIITRMLYNLKGVYLSAGEGQKALTLIELLLRLNPKLVEEIRDRGLVKNMMGDYEGALEDLNKYLESSPSSQDRLDVKRFVDTIKLQIEKLR